MSVCAVGENRRETASVGVARRAPARTGENGRGSAKIGYALGVFNRHVVRRETDAPEPFTPGAKVQWAESTDWPLFELECDEKSDCDRQLADAQVNGHRLTSRGLTGRISERRHSAPGKVTYLVVG